MNSRPHHRKVRQVVGQPFYDTLQRALKEGDGQKLRQIADKLVALAIEGEEWAVKEIANRLDGKPRESVSIEATINDNRPIEQVPDEQLGDLITGLLAARSGAGADESATGAGEPRSLQ